jgi:hypothetical protein
MSVSVEKAESAAIRVAWIGPLFHYDLRWYESRDFIVPVRWIGVAHCQPEELAHRSSTQPALPVMYFAGWRVAWAQTWPAGSSA